MDSPLSPLLSQVLVAYAIEFDNEFEIRLSKTWARPFRVSLVMWSNFMRFVRPDGTSVGDIVAASCIPTAAVATVVGGMERWGYISVDHDPATSVGAPRKGFGSGRGIKDDTVIYPSQVGALSIGIWEPLVREIEGRWKQRMGETEIEGLRAALGDVLGGVGFVMPHFLPIVGGGGMFADRELASGSSAADDMLPALLSRVLLAFTLDYEADARVALPIAANVLRVIGDDGVRAKDLPLRSGVSKEAISMSMTWLERAGLVSVEPGKVAKPTEEGRCERDAYPARLGETETAWEKRFGADAIGSLRESLLLILDRQGGEDGPLSAGLVTPPGGWRATGRYKPLTAAFIKSPRDGLPHYPMVLHRGGWPDGS